MFMSYHSGEPRQHEGGPIVCEADLDDDGVGMLLRHRQGSQVYVYMFGGML